ncbi:zinc knuckle [Cooperia oncophora]
MEAERMEENHSPKESVEAGQVRKSKLCGLGQKRKWKEFGSRARKREVLSPLLKKEITETLARRGIECVDDWKEYVRTMEQDGEVMAELCEILNTDVFQELLDRRPVNCRGCVRLGQTSADHSRRHSLYRTTTPPVDEGASVSDQLTMYLRAMACTDPGVYRGARNENFNEFVRRFKRNVKRLLLEILCDDHLGGRAKNIYKALPRLVKDQGFEMVIKEMSRLLAQESTAGRLRALTELRELKIRPNQDVADFCVVLENLGQQAFPEGNAEDRSLEYAQILLSNLGDWPEHFQLVGALHKVQPYMAHDEVKQLPLSIEQSKLMLGVNSNVGKMSWRNRSAQYCCVSEEESLDRARPWARQEPCRRDPCLADGCGYQPGAQMSPPNDRVATRTSGSEARKCYTCSKYGHISRDCPQRTTRVTQIKHKRQTQRKKKYNQQGAWLRDSGEKTETGIKYLNWRSDHGISEPAQ